jgi:hypothetical protein
VEVQELLVLALHQHLLLALAVQDYPQASPGHQLFTLAGAGLQIRQQIQ